MKERNTMKEETGYREGAEEESEERETLLEELNV